MTSHGLDSNNAGLLRWHAGRLEQKLTALAGEAAPLSPRHFELAAAIKNLRAESIHTHHEIMRLDR